MRKRLLLVDDDPISIEILKEMLKEQYDIQVANTGQEALNLLPRYKLMLIVTDVVMPGLTGYGVCEKIRSDKRWKDTKVILVSARGLPNDQKRGYEVGADEYISKPFDYDLISQKVGQLLN